MPTSCLTTKGVLYSVVIPAFNEGDRIGETLVECVEVMRDLHAPFEIVAVDDGSSDNTRSEIEMISERYPEVMLVTYTQNGGKGNALKAGYRHANGKLVTFMDADLEIHPKHLISFKEAMERSGADIVIGSKRHPDSKVDYPAKRRFLSWGYNLLVRALFRVKLSDTQPGFKLFRREVLDTELRKTLTKKYSFDLELLVNAQEDGFKIVEAPIELNFNRENGGRIGFDTARSIFQETLGIFFRLKIKGAYSNVSRDSQARSSVNWR